MAFGTGTHETTSLCIEYLQKVVNDGDKILDVGCGSGILSITSLLCGASEALALDIDLNAVKVSYENAELNNFSGKFEAVCDNILDPESEIRKRLNGKKYNVIVANIVADIIIRLSDFIYEYLEDDGTFIVSGIITERENDVLNALDKNNFKVIDRSEKKGWVCIKTNR
ncbi:MAG: 50S ribosomal protein L11 methyltransferase, partial [Clostridia bacterium]|nr:50S ribosomal protein L11 methyltransferase [Clostridia bacterium]